MFIVENVEGMVYRAWEDVDICRDCIARIDGCDLPVSECELAKSFALAIKRFCLGQTPSYQTI